MPDREMMSVISAVMILSDAVIVAVVPGMALARGNLRILNLSNMIRWQEASLLLPIPIQEEPQGYPHFIRLFDVKEEF
jgi:hypothetical protein